MGAPRQGLGNNSAPCPSPHPYLRVLLFLLEGGLRTELGSPEGPTLPDGRRTLPPTPLMGPRTMASSCSMIWVGTIALILTSRPFTESAIPVARVEELRAWVKNEFRSRRALLDAEERIQARRVDQLRSEQSKLLQAHYADAIPLELLRTEQQRIATELKAAQNRLMATQANFETINENLDKALKLAGDCHAMYLDANSRVRRLMNQAFFTRLVIDREGDITGELAAPFALLLGNDFVGRRTGRERRSRKVVSPVRRARTRTPIFLGSGVTPDVLVAPAVCEDSG